jgi:hypothetical protein
MLTVAIESDCVSKVVVARERDARAQGRALATISWQLQTSSSGSPGNVRCPIGGSIVDHHNLCHMLPGPLHNLGDVRGFVECRN